MCLVYIKYACRAELKEKQKVANPVCTLVLLALEDTGQLES